MTAITDTRRTLSEVKDVLDVISRENKIKAATYVADIRDILKARTNYNVRELNNVISEKIRDLETELVNFDLVVAGVGNGLVDIFRHDVNDLCEKVSKIESENASRALQTALYSVEQELADMLKDMDQMYAYYGDYFGDFVQSKARNITGQISDTLEAQRRYCDCTYSDRVKMCYDISDQNGLITDQLHQAMRAVAILQDAREKVELLESYFEKDENLKQIYDDLWTLVNAEKDADQEFLNSIVEKESYYLGSTLAKTAFTDNVYTKAFARRSFKTPVKIVPFSVYEIFKDFPIVNVEHTNDMQNDVDVILKKLGDAIKEKASLANAGDREEIIAKADFTDLRRTMRERFAKLEQATNSKFEEKKKLIANLLECDVECIIKNQLASIPGLSVANYLPTEECSLSVEFQKYVSLTLEESAVNRDTTSVDDVMDSIRDLMGDKEDGESDGDGIGVEISIPSANVFKSANDTAQSGIAKNEGLELSPSLVTLIQNVVSAFVGAGYELEGVEVNVERD